MKAVVLAGGFGTRIRPLTAHVPKPMLPLVNRPILAHILDLLKTHGFQEIIMLLYYHPEAIQNYFGDGSEFGVRIHYVTPPYDYGTAGALKQAEGHLQGEEDPFLVISGDVLTDFDLTELVRFHREKGAEATLALTRVSNPLQFGIVITDAEGAIRKFLEKPSWGDVFSDTVNTGIYVLQSSVLNRIPEDQEFDFSKDLFPKMLEEKAPLYGYIAEGYWRDIGDPDAYIEAHADIFRGLVSIRIPGKKVDLVGRDVRVGKDVVWGKRVQFQGTVVLGHNVKIGSHVVLANCAIGNNSVIEDGTVIQGAVIWDNAFIKSGARIQEAVIGSGVRIGEEAVVEARAVVGDHCSVGRRVQIRPGVKIWPEKVIEDEAVVDANLIWGERWRRSLFEGATVVGLTNVELTPEFTAKLGAAYGTVLPKGVVILTGRDPHRSSRMLRRAFVGGLASTGVHIQDAQLVPLPVMRFKLSAFGEVGGVYFRQSPDDPPSTEITFFDNRGIELSPGVGKSIERIFFREEFRRAHYNEPGEISDIPKILDFYEEAFLKTLAASTGQRDLSGFKIVVDFSHGSGALVLPELLNALHVDYVALNAHIDDLKLAKREEEIQEALAVLSKIVVTLKRDFGVLLGTAGERITLVDDRGRVIEGLDLLTLMVRLLALERREGVVAVPPYASHVVEEVAGSLSVRRIATSPRIMGEEALKEGVILVGSGDGRLIFPEFHAAPDGMYAVARIMAALRKVNRPLSALYDEIPRVPLLYERVSCPLDRKGEIMRRLSEEAMGKEASFLDGVKVVENGGWVMVHPDHFRPVFHIYVEHREEAEARDLLDRYVRRIRAWIQEERR